MRISDWSSDVCSSDLQLLIGAVVINHSYPARPIPPHETQGIEHARIIRAVGAGLNDNHPMHSQPVGHGAVVCATCFCGIIGSAGAKRVAGPRRSEEHTSELQSLMRISYAVLCLKKKIQHYNHINSQQNI